MALVLSSHAEKNQEKPLGPLGPGYDLPCSTEILRNSASDKRFEIDARSAIYVYIRRKYLLRRMPLAWLHMEALFPGGGGGYSIYPLVGRCGAAPITLTLFKTNVADFPTLFKTEFRFFNTLFKTFNLNIN